MCAVKYQEGKEGHLQKLALLAIYDIPIPEVGILESGSRIGRPGTRYLLRYCLHRSRHGVLHSRGEIIFEMAQEGSPETLFGPHGRRYNLGRAKPGNSSSL